MDHRVVGAQLDRPVGKRAAKSATTHPLKYAVLWALNDLSAKTLRDSRAADGDLFLLWGSNQS